VPAGIHRYLQGFLVVLDAFSLLDEILYCGSGAQSRQKMRHEHSSRRPVEGTESAAAELEDLGAQVRAALAEALLVPVERVDLDAELEDALGIDSLRLILVNIALEERFGVVMPDPGETPLRRVADLVAFVHRQLAACAPA
jgi:acyl carrier protein